MPVMVHVSHILATSVANMSLILKSGDVELNPGPGRFQGEFHAMCTLKDGEQVAKVGGEGGAQTFDIMCTMTTGRLWACAHSPPRGAWGHAPPETFGNFNSLRTFLMYSGSNFWTDLVTILT